MAEQIPSIGRIVQFRLSGLDAAQINRRRTTSASIAERMSPVPPLEGSRDYLHSPPPWPIGAQAHIGNEAKEGDVFPMIITKVFGASAESAVNGQVLLDGNDVFWATTVFEGVGLHCFSWPKRV